MPPIFSLAKIRRALIYVKKPDNIIKYDCLEIGGIAMRVQVTLACTETGDRNYITSKNKRTHPERMELNKFCPRLNRYTLHRETK